MCVSCDQNAELARQQTQLNHRAQQINHQYAAIQSPLPSTVGINQQLAVQAYQQRILQEAQRKSGIRQPQKQYR